MADTDVPVTPDNSQPLPDPSMLDSTGPSVPSGGPITTPDTSQPSATDVLASSPSSMMNQAAAVHHSRIADSLNTVGKWLGGDSSYHITPNSDGSVSATPVEMTPGQRWGRIAQAALLGAAKGFAVGQGPGGAQRAAAAGVETGMALPQAQQDQTMALAQKTNDQNQQRQLFNANIAYLNTRNLEQSWQLDQNKKLAQEHDEAGDLQFNALSKQLHMVDVGPAANIEQAATIYNGNPQVQQALVGKGGQLVIHHPASGPPHAYIIPEDKLTQLNPNEQTAFDWSVDPKTLQVVQGQHSVSANTETGLQTAARIAKEQSDKLAAIKTAADAQLKAAQAGKETAEANAPPKEIGTWQQFEDPNTGAPMERNDKTGAIRPMTQGLARMGTFDKRMAAQEKEFGPAVAALNYANDYLGSGDFTGPSDEALMDKFFELAKSSKGFKMTTPQQNLLLNARSTIDSLKANLTHKLTPNAPYFANDQRANIIKTMKDLGASNGINMVNGRAMMPPLAPRTAPAATGGGGAGGGNIQIPEPSANVRTGPATIPTTFQGKQGSINPTNGMFTSNDGTVSMKMPGWQGGGITVTTPNGKSFDFPNQAAADAFKKKAGMMP